MAEAESNQTEQAWLRRMLFLCKRGNLETELLLSAYSLTLLHACEADRRLFEQLLLESDQALFNWLLKDPSANNVTGHEIPTCYQGLIDAIRNNYLITNQ
ncbi:succinate dehydrogenase assembly factor 2 [Thiomicrorhabdus sp. ZW0627]|uniref:FAD assembly factor SdhE n=1 Tax=Thiomicrorhabdus sp. ZW0627 TaxID=3039774 RepID=UPI00243663E5|nr:succinate dehydrogenase assembly factor 2 [Thiomicrorhabdus sp. ZW0627]MDG6773105.1 succinate dehydrogenase assembly factor 2 [Thiomicrorhabdus sp. ZW0627]